MESFPNKHSNQFAATQLQGGEKIQMVLEGWIGDLMGKGKDKQQNGSLILTNQRLVFFKKGWMGNVFQYMRLNDIKSVETSSFMKHRVVTAHSSHDELKFKTFEEKLLFEKFCSHLRAPEAKTTVAIEKGPDPISQLEGLDRLRKAGIIEEDEFKLKKAELLLKIK